MKSLLFEVKKGSFCGKWINLNPEKFGVKYSETDADVTTNMDLARRPDGSVVNNIPIRFVEKLPNTAVQTTDVLGSVIAYYDMACNYANKSKNLPTLELIKYAIDPSKSTTGN